MIPPPPPPTENPGTSPNLILNLDTFLSLGLPITLKLSANMQYFPFYLLRWFASFELKLIFVRIFFCHHKPFTDHKSIKCYQFMEIVPMKALSTIEILKKMTKCCTAYFKFIFFSPNFQGVLPIIWWSLFKCLGQSTRHQPKCSSTGHINNLLIKYHCFMMEWITLSIQSMLQNQFVTIKIKPTYFI